MDAKEKEIEKKEVTKKSKKKKESKFSLIIDIFFILCGRYARMLL